MARSYARTAGVVVLLGGPTALAFFSGGYFDEARDYMHFLHDLQIKSGDQLRIMYGIRGEFGEQLHEAELTHLEGYRGSPHKL